jgi:hypothetical protein
MSRRRPSLDPCELPRESLYSKTYRAALLGDGSVLPIEERLGRRILRTIEPESAEGRRLLGAGQVVLRGEGEEWREPIDEVLERLERSCRDEMEGEALEEPEARRQLESTLAALERHRRGYRS